MLVERNKTFPDIDPKSWEHPADRATLAAIRGVKGLDDIFRVLQGATAERSMRLVHLASSVKATPRQYAKLYAMVGDVVRTFDWPYRPDIFVTRSPFFNAGVYGVDKPFIVMNNATVASLTDEELKAVVAHEMGHVMSGHALYKTLIWFLSNLAVNAVPGGELVILPLMLALSEWDRRSELTADRVGLLALQSEEPCYTLLMKMAGGDDLSQLNMNDFFEQAAEYENSNTILDGFFKVLNTAFISHPFPVTRLSELRNWAASGHYKTILDGVYLKRSVAPGDPANDVKVGFDFYKSEFEKSADPMGQAFKSAGSDLGAIASGLGEGLGKAAQAAMDALKGLFPGS